MSLGQQATVRRKTFSFQTGFVAPDEIQRRSGNIILSTIRAFQNKILKRN
jgi:hypothetical protein